MSTRQGVILLAHGARSAAWAAPFERLAAGLERSDRPVRLAFLEFMQPDLSCATDELVAQGCTSIQLLPCFLAGAGHVLRDLPELLAKVQHRHTAVRWTVLPALGEQPPFQQALLSVCDELLKATR